MKRALLAILFLGSTYALAIDEGVVGNGGDVLLCDYERSAELLDLYEGRTLRGFRFDTNLIGANEEATIANIIARLEPFDSHRAMRYSKHATEFWNEVAFVPDAELIDISDSKHIAIPNGCSIEQIVIQTQPKFDEDPRYIVNKDLWDLMSIEGRAALVLHEIIYREAIEKGEQNSIGTRYLNSLLSSRKFATFTQDQYDDVLKRLGWDITHSRLIKQLDGIHLDGYLRIFVTYSILFTCKDGGLRDISDEEFNTIPFYPKMTEYLINNGLTEFDVKYAGEDERYYSFEMTKGKKTGAMNPVGWLCKE